VQAEFRNGTAGNGQWKEPYYWAAWQLVGDWRPVQGV
jgi:CHAT domain-containing protein